VELKLQLPAGVELRRVHRVFPTLGAFDPGPASHGKYSLLLGNFDPAEPAALLVEFLLPAWQTGIYRLAQAELAWDQPEGSPPEAASGEAARGAIRQDITLQVAAQREAPNARVMNIVERAGAFRLGSLALAAAEKGDPAATQRLRAAATRLLDMGEAELAGAMLDQVQSLEQDGALDPNATKRLRYETRRLAQHS
jgi:Ca-activated chloride channel family protein